MKLTFIELLSLFKKDYILSSRLIFYRFISQLKRYVTSANCNNKRNICSLRLDQRIEEGRS